MSKNLYTFRMPNSDSMIGSSRVVQAQEGESIDESVWFASKAPSISNAPLRFDVGFLQRLRGPRGRTNQRIDRDANQNLIHAARLCQIRCVAPPEASGPKRKTNQRIYRAVTQNFTHVEHPSQIRSSSSAVVGRRRAHRRCGVHGRCGARKHCDIHRLRVAHGCCGEDKRCGIRTQAA